MGSVFLDITIIIFIASFVAVIFRSLRQPLILAYIFTGILLGPLAIVKLHDVEAMHSFAQLGITLVLFMLGLELKIKELRSIGTTALLAGVLQVVGTFAAGFAIALLLGFSAVAGSYLAIALTFSSTIIIIKLLSDKKDLNSLYGKMSVGILLVQDFVAVLLLMGLSTFSNTVGFSVLDLALVVLKGFLLVSLMYIVSRTLLPWMLFYAAKSSETLFLFSLAWVFSVAGIISSPLFGFSIEMGGFMAGLTLANFSENFQIIGKIRPLRDFFVTIFFVLLGFEMSFTHLQTVFLPAIILTLFVLLLKPYIATVILGALGFKKRTAFMTGISLGQVSEFSLIVLFLGAKLGHIPSSLGSLFTLVAVFSFVFSTSIIQQGSKVYKWFESFLVLPQRSHGLEHHEDMGELKDHIVVIGAHQMGQSILHALDKTDEKVIVVDFDPDIIAKLKRKEIAHLFGDIVDVDIQEQAQLDTARLVVSTITDLEDNLILIKKLNKENRRAKIIVVAYEANEAKTLYKAGADYVVLPHLAGGMHLAKIIKDKNLEHVEKFKSQDFMELL